MAWGAFRAREGAPAGKSWAFRRLLLGGGVFAALTAMTFWALDDGVRGRIQALRAEAGVMALAAAAPASPTPRTRRRSTRRRSGRSRPSGTGRPSRRNALRSGSTKARRRRN